MSILSALALLTALQVKHMFADFWFQTAWMLEGKRRYGGLGGLAHAGVHAGLTFAIFMVFGCALLTSLVVAVGEWALHYHIDWIKARHGAQNPHSPDDIAYWRALGVDQLAHQLTYVLLVAIAVN